MNKYLSSLSGILLLINVLLTSPHLLGTTEAAAELPSQYPLVYVYPEFASVPVGETFTISVVVYNLTNGYAQDPDNPPSRVPLGNLYGFDVQFSWDPMVIRYVNYTNADPAAGGYHHPDVTTPVEKYPDPVPPSPYAGVLHGFGIENKEIWEMKNVVNETGNIPYASDPEVRAWFAYVSLLPAGSFNGNSTLFTMSFRVLKEGESPLEIVSVILASREGFPVAVGSQGTWLNEPRSGVFRSEGVGIVDFSHDQDVEVANKTIVFNASVNGNDAPIVKYLWDFGDGTNATTEASSVGHEYLRGGFYEVNLKVMDVNGRSSAASHAIRVANTENLVVGTVETSQDNVLPNRLFYVWAAVGFTADPWWKICQNVTVTLSYNATVFDPDDPEAASWVQIADYETQVESESEVLAKFALNSSQLPAVEARYSFLLNATGIAQGYEGDLTDNVKISSPITYTGSVVHQPKITYLDYRAFLIEGEDAEVRFGIQNRGNELDSFRATIYVDGSPVQTFQTLMLEPGAKESLTWRSALEAGYPDVRLEIWGGNVTLSTQLWFHIVKPPKITVSYSPTSPLVTQEVILDASKSIHQDPQGNITLYDWRIYAPSPKPWYLCSPYESLNGSTVVFSFPYTGNWTIVLKTMDSFFMFYSPGRPATEAYMFRFQIYVDSITGDVNLDGVVGIEDIVAAAGQYGLKPSDSDYYGEVVMYADVAPPYDGVVDILDLVTIIAHYGEKT